MKSFICAILLFALMVAGTGFYTNHLEKSLDSLLSQVKTLEVFIHKQDWTEAKKQFCDLEKDWDAKQSWLKAFVNHEEIEEIEKTICEIRGYVAYENAEDALLKAGVLAALLQHLPENESLTLNNIL